MRCRIGMATDVDERVKDLKKIKLVPTTANLKIIGSGLTYDEANQLEDASRDECGSHCEGQTGGREVLGPVWSVYRLDWIDIAS